MTCGSLSGVSASSSTAGTEYGGRSATSCSGSRCRSTITGTGPESDLARPSGCAPASERASLLRVRTGPGSSTRCAPTAVTTRSKAVSSRRRSRTTVSCRSFRCWRSPLPSSATSAAPTRARRTQSLKPCRTGHTAATAQGQARSTSRTSSTRRAGAGVVGLVGLFYAGLGWLDALRAALRRVFGTSDVPLVFVKKKAVDVVVLIGLGLALLASLVVTTALATAVTDQVLGGVGIDDKLVAVALLKVLSVALALLADTALFAILLSRLSGAHQTWRQVRAAAVLGPALGFESGVAQGSRVRSSSSAPRRTRSTRRSVSSWGCSSGSTW